ncbi:membrane eicosanoid glutathione metabolism [Fusarium sp. NRRL 25303]|nr:membrane eicosanoid glutathione metabolism [Fusarium sp. NRRL 25303]
MSPSIQQLPLLGPLVGLSTWTFAMEGLLYWRRTPALSKYGVSFDPETAKKQKAEKLPAFVQWPADNYNNLLEQPTQFYAAVAALTLLNVKDKVTVRLAWTYVGLRVIHSLIHVSYNNLLLRFPTFAVSSVVLLGMTVKAALELWY